MKKLIVILAVIAMVGAFTATAIADVSLYGSARFRTYWTDTSKEADATGFDDSDLEWQMGYLTRFGANFKGDKINGKMEMDARVATSGSYADGALAGTGASSVGDMRLRQLWGQYDFGSFKFMIGQNYPLYDAPVSGLNYYSGGLQKFGGIGYTVARTSQMRFTMGNFRLALLPTDVSKGGVGAYTEDTDTLFPKLELRYDMKADAFALNFIGGYQNYGAVNDADADVDINSWLLAARGKVNFGPAYAGLSLSYRQNGGNYGAWTNVDENARITASGSDVEDTTAVGFVAALGFKLNDSNTFEASYGYVKSENDAGNMEDKAQAFGLMWKYTVAPGFYIVPEFIYQDNQDKKDQLATPPGENDKGDVTILGVFWRIDFK
jgi:hypothetical protein